MYRCRVRDPAWTLTGMPCDGEVIISHVVTLDNKPAKHTLCIKCGAINGAYEYAEKEYGHEYEHYWRTIGNEERRGD